MLQPDLLSALSAPRGFLFDLFCSKAFSYRVSHLCMTGLFMLLSWGW